MEFSSTYNLDLPTPLAQAIIERIEEHMENMRMRSGFGTPKSSDFVVPGVLHIPNLIYFDHLEYTEPSSRETFKSDIEHAGYAPSYDPNRSRIQLKFTAWQVVTNL